MTENQQNIQYANQAIMLDLSLFVLDILDADKIKQKPEDSDHILEVPGALTLMMRDAESGSPILFLFIYSLLKKLHAKYVGTAVTDQRLIRIANARQDYQIREIALTATERLFKEFASLIENASHQIKTVDDFSLDNQKKSKTHEYPIRRHDGIGALSSYEQTKLQEAYVHELNLPRHDLYDLYFAQIYHAQSVGVQDNRYIPEITISLENDIFRVISRWQGTRELDPIDGEDVIKSGRKEIFKFRERYVRKERDEFIYNASHEISLAVIPAIAVAAATGGNVASAALAAGAVSLITLTGGTITRKIIDDKKKHPYERVFWGVISFLGTIVIVLLCTAITEFIPLVGINPNATPTATIYPEILYTPTLLASPTLLPTSTVTPIPTATHTTTPVPSATAATVFNSNYCRYLTQPGDTAQSISSWFGISEATYRAENNLYSGTELTAGQIVTISAPCCNAQYPSWHAYEVKQGDRLYNIATLSGLSVNDLAYANHITNQGYIQVGQMLCVPPNYP